MRIHDIVTKAVLSVMELKGGGKSKGKRLTIMKSEVCDLLDYII